MVICVTLFAVNLSLGITGLLYSQVRSNVDEGFSLIGPHHVGLLSKIHLITHLKFPSVSFIISSVNSMYPSVWRELIPVVNSVGTPADIATTLGAYILFSLVSTLLPSLSVRLYSLEM